MEPISGATRTLQQFDSIIGGIFKRIAPLTAEKLSVAQYCTEVATSCQIVHHELVENEALLKQNKGAWSRYYRLNVNTAGMSGIGLQEDEKMDKISQGD